MSNEKRSKQEPHDRLTRICDAMAQAREAHPEHRPGDKCIIFMDDEKKGGLVLAGYENDADALAAIFSHLRAIFRANGSDLTLAPLHGEPERN